MGRADDGIDHRIIGHRNQRLELLLFYRKGKSEHPGAGFRYEGPFEYAKQVSPCPPDNATTPTRLGD